MENEIIAVAKKMENRINELENELAKRNVLKDKCCKDGVTTKFVDVQSITFADGSVLTSAKNNDSVNYKAMYDDLKEEHDQAIKDIDFLNKELIESKRNNFDEKLIDKMANVKLYIKNIINQIDKQHGDLTQTDMVNIINNVYLLKKHVQ